MHLVGRNICFSFGDFSEYEMLQATVIEIGEKVA